MQETQIVELLNAVLKKLDLPDINVELFHPAEEKHGDWATNIALQLHAQSKDVSAKFSSPLEMAKAITEEIEKNIGQKAKSNTGTVLRKVEVAGPGFINFHLNEQFLLSQLSLVNDEKENYGKNTAKIAGKVMVEHTQPNTNKPNHIGHLRNSVLGMSVVKILRSVGYEVVSTNVNNDRGIANIKGMWAYLYFGNGVNNEMLDHPQEVALPAEFNWKEKLTAWLAEQAAWSEPAGFGIKPDKWVGQFYVMGDNSYEASDEVKKEMASMLQAWENEDEGVRKLWRQLNDWFYQGSWQTLKRLGVELDLQEYESDLYKKGKEIIERAVSDGVPGFIRLEDGAIQAKLTKYGLPDKILVRKDGTAIYMTFDVELTRKRSQDYGMALGVWVVGVDQVLHFQQLFAICEELGLGKKEQWHHLAYGMVRLPEGKMSSRKGRVITADSVLDEAIERTKEVMSQSNIQKNLTSDEENKVVDQVAMAAVKFGMLSFTPLSSVVFDIDRAVSFEGNSGPYIQYTYARTRSIMSKADKPVIGDQQSVVSDQFSVFGNANTENREPKTENFNDEELAILRWLYRYPEVVAKAAGEYAPHLICTYLNELAQRFNTFYNKHRILSFSPLSKDLERTPSDSMASEVSTEQISNLKYQFPNNDQIQNSNDLNKNQTFDTGSNLNEMSETESVVSDQLSVAGEDNTSKFSDSLELNAENQKLKTEFRLSLTSAVGIVLKNGLDLLGIEAPEKM